MAWAPGNRSGGGKWRTLAAYSTQKERKAAAQNPVLVDTFGVLDATLSSFTSLATGVLATLLNPRTGSLSATLSPFTVTATGALKIQGSLSRTLNSFVLQATVGPLQTPTLTNFSATGAAPVVLSITDGDYIAGKYLEWEFAASLTPAKNANGSYATPSQRGVTFIDGDSWARLDLALGYVDPSGAFSFHCRVLRENDNSATAISYVDSVGNTIGFNADTSGWTTDYSDTITSSVAVLNSVNGINKCRYADIVSPYHQYIIHNIGNVGQMMGARLTIKAQPDQYHIEFKGDTTHNPSGQFYCGFDNGSAPNFDQNPGSLSPTAYPGASGVAGITARCTIGNGSMTVWRNGSSTSFGLASAWANGDILAWENTTSTNQYKVYHIPAATGTPSLRATITLTSGTLTNAFGFVGGGYGSGSAVTGDAGSVNAGGSSFVMSPTAGYSMYG